jgi:ATP-dependent DNA helicase RecG
MRPSVLNPLFASASGIKGIGQKLDKVLAQFLRGDAAAPTRIVDLLFHLPNGVVDRRFRPHIVDLPREGIVTIEVKVGRHKPPPPFNKKLPYRVEVFDQTGSLTLVFFHAFAEHLQRSLPQGETRFISGEISWYGEEPQIAHPDHILTAEDFSRMPLIEPVYPLTAGLSPKILGRAIRSALERLPELAEWQDGAWKKKHGWTDFSAALKLLHSPQISEAPSIDSPARLRLAYDELLANQLALSLVRGHMKRATGRSFVGNGARQAKIISALPYKLTNGQTFANAEIQADMASPSRMLRLLQGDVGSGKTIVALLALATAVEC